MQYALKVDKRRRITLPKKLLDELGWRIGTKIIFRHGGPGQIIIEKAPEKPVAVQNSLQLKA